MEGSRVSKPGKENPGGKKGIIIAGVILAVVMGAYLGVCAWAGGNSNMLPNVTVAGLDVSGLSQEQAQTLLHDAVEERGHLVTVDLTYASWSGQMDGAQVELNSAETIQQAYDVGRGSFLGRGAQYISHLLGGGTDVPISLALSDAGRQDLDNLLQKAQQHVGDGVIQPEFQVEGDKLVLTTGVTGIAIHNEETETAVETAFTTSFAQVFEGGPAQQAQVVLTVEETAPEKLDLNVVHQQVYTKPVDAQLDPTTYLVTDHVVGMDFDVAQAQSAVDAAGEGEDVSISLDLTQPAETKTSLEGKLFTDVLGKATSAVGGSSSRKFNVKLSAEACNNIILLPGDIFSYNNTTGSRSEAKGYLPAPVYVGGKSEDGVGGGICQTSSTIYNAVLYTRLKIVERKPHMYAVGYVLNGMDATAFFGQIDFRFENDTDYPVKIVTSSYDSGGKRYLTVTIYGTKTDDIKVTLDSVSFDYVQPGIKYVADDTVAQGTTVVDKKQNAYTGCKATVYRYLYDADGKLIEKQDLGTSTYKSRDKSIHYNPLDGDPATWVNGVPPQPVDPNVPVDPVTPPVDPVDPVTPPVDPVDPGTPVDPVEPGTVPDPVTDIDPASGDNTTGEEETTNGTV